MDKHSSALLEKIPHITQARPFSIHHTIIPPLSDSVLYLHWHNEVELLYIEQGEALFYIEEVEFHLKKGEAIFIPPDLLHMAKGYHGSSCEFYALVFSTTYIFDSYQNPQYEKYVLPIKYANLQCTLHLAPFYQWHGNILNYLKDIFSLALSSDLTSWELQLHGILLIVWQELYNKHLSNIEVPKNIRRLSLQLEAALSCIHNLYATEITLVHLATICYLSQGQFCRLFKQLTGLRPFSYLYRYRILKSCELLQHTQKKVAEIATLCGFNNISYYNREFVKIMKMTPSAYRKAVLNK